MELYNTVLQYWCISYIIIFVYWIIINIRETASGTGRPKRLANKPYEVLHYMLYNTCKYL